MGINEKGQLHNIINYIMRDKNIVKTPINDKGQEHGHWLIQTVHGGLIFEGFFINGDELGYWIIFWPNGKLNYTENYVNGEKYGYYHYVDYKNIHNGLVDREEQGYVAR